MGKDYYALLGLSKNASMDDIRKSYKKLARQYHPDLNPDQSSESEEKFKEITEAYEVLKDSEKREIYDQYGEEGLKNGGGGMGGGMGGFGDIFDMFGGGGFGGRGGGAPRGPTKSESIKHALSASLEDLYNGSVRKIRVTRTRNCKSCDGVGASKKEAVKTCAACDGRGMINEMRQVAPGFVSQVRRSCHQCNGEGKTMDPKFMCKKCNGKKVVSEQKVLEVHIDKGMKNGQKIVFENEADERPGVQAGDIIFIVQEKPHAHFKRDGQNLIFEKKINLSEALTGVEFVIDHLDKRKLLVRNKPGEVIKPGQIKQINNEGMPTYRNPYEKGSLLVRFDVEFPKRIPDDVAKKLMSLLPPKSKTQAGVGSDIEEHLLEEYVPGANRQNNRGGEAYMSDEEDEERGGQGVSCAQQ